MSAFGDFWDSNIVPIGPQDKIIAGMSPSAREELRTRLRGSPPQIPASGPGRCRAADTLGQMAAPGTFEPFHRCPLHGRSRGWCGYRSAAAL